MRLWLVSPAARAILVSALFWWCVGYGWWVSRLSHRAALVFAALFLAGALASPYLAAGQYAFVAWIAVLDVVLVLMVYHRNPGLKELR